MVDLINQSGVIGQVIVNWHNLTGSEFITYLLIIIFLVLVGVVFRVDFELTLLFCIPVIFTVGAFIGGNIIAIIIISVILFGFSMARAILRSI